MNKILKKQSVGAFMVAVPVLIACAIASASVPGTPDPTFGASAYGAVSGTVIVTKRQPDGKILIGGVFLEINGHASSGIARLNPDGTVDTSFVPPLFLSSDASGGEISAIGVQSDGKIVVAGNFLGVTGDAYGRGVRRLNPDGSLDTGFAVYPLLGSDTPRDIAIQADDKILLGGSSSPGPGLFVRINPNGTVDGSFSAPTDIGTVFGIALQSDGKILVGGPATVKRLQSDGTVDAAFSSPDANNGSVVDVAVRPDGKILIGGVFATLNGSPFGRIALLNQNGTPDPTFNQSNVGANASVRKIELLADGKILIGGSFSSFNSVERQKVARLNANGSLDTSFVNNPMFSAAQVSDVLVLNDGRVLIGNGQVSLSFAAVVLNSDGSTDTTTEYVLSFGGRVRKLLVLSTGKILVAGHFNYISGVRRRSLARLNADGTLDLSFVPYFNSDTIGTISLNALVEQPDGKLLVSGIDGFNVKRLNDDGSLDPTFRSPFSSAATPFDLALLPDGRIMVVGTLTDGTGAPTRHIVRLLPNGERDVTFEPSNPNAPVYCLVRQPDGKFVIGGDFTSVGGQMTERLVRLNENGTVDGSFDTTTGASGSVFNLLLQPDGKILLSGAFLSLRRSNSAVRIGRLNADGSRDTGFAQNINGIVIGLALQSDGKILAGGSFSLVGGVERSGIVRLNANGSLDPSFRSGTERAVLDIKMQQPGRALIGGEFMQVDGRPKLRLTRLLTSVAPFDFDGDGRSDFSVFRPSSSTWFELFSSDSQIGQLVFGTTGDIPCPADFDGDGLTDEAIFRPSTGQFWYWRSIDGGVVNKQWGQPGDVPRPSDFDGDGSADLIVYRPSDSVWYRLGSTGQISIASFGIADDQPQLGDFDGDGKSDLAVFRQATGDWWYAASGSAFEYRSTHWGQPGDIPAPADFDGDGTTDLAVFRPSNGAWYVLKSGDGSYTILSFGLSGDRPVPADYDGDGRADIAVFRPSTGVWYVIRSTGGTIGIQWGISTDIALPNTFVGHF